MVAPTPVSALLHAVAIVKAGVFTVLKIVVYVFGIEFRRSRRIRLVDLCSRLHVVELLHYCVVKGQS